MANEIVKYHNDLNTAVMTKWTAEEFNIFFTILAKVKEKGTNTIEITAQEIKELIEHNQSRSKLINIIDKALDKMMILFYKEGKGAGSRRMSIFDIAEIDEDGVIVTIKMSSQYEYILNRLSANFTIFELAEYVRLKSIYSKSMFRLLKQWRTIGKKRFKKKDLFLFLDVPKSTQTTANFTNKVLKPIQEELTPIFQDLKIVPIRAKTQGRPITHYEFTWKPETSGQWIEGKYDKPKFNDKKSKQEIVPEWMQNRPANHPAQQTNPSPEIIDNEAEIRAKLASLIDESE